MSTTPLPHLRPKDMALLLLASGELLPRQRARDQESDRAGNTLKSRMLNALIEFDPAPEQLEAALEQIIAAFGPPTGPTRAIAVGIREEWQAACASPEFVEWLLAQAVHTGLEPTEGHGRGQKTRQVTAPPEPATS